MSSKVVVSVSNTTSDIAVAAAARGQAHLRSFGIAGCDGFGAQVCITSVSVTVISSDETLDERTDYSYSVNYTALGAGRVHEVRATAASPYGVQYALETVAQLAKKKCHAFAVSDAPAFPHRGLMIDTGRRFYSVGLVESILDGMAMYKMNVLHMYLSELCFRVESKLFPEVHSRPCVAGGLNNSEYYAQDDVARLVAYARARGIRIIPEFDMPGHSTGLCAGLAAYGIQCCAPGYQIRDDAAGQSVKVVTALLGEMSALFPDAVFDVGGDETGSTAPCTLDDTRSFEEKVLGYVTDTLKKVPMGWEEILFKTGAAATFPRTIVDAWARSSWQAAAKRGHRAVASNNANLYLDYASTYAPALWFDMTGGSDVNASFLLGGEASMWQDFYVPGARTKAQGSASCLFDDARDADFANSTAATIWPRAAVAAGSFYRYDATRLDAASADFADLLNQITADLAARGAHPCPCATTTAIGCDQNTFCGHVFCPNG